MVVAGNNGLPMKYKKYTKLFKIPEDFLALLEV